VHGYGSGTCGHVWKIKKEVTRIFICISSQNKLSTGGTVWKTQYSLCMIGQQNQLGLQQNGTVVMQFTFG